jgi:hypothetical protein
VVGKGLSFELIGRLVAMTVFVHFQQLSGYSRRNDDLPATVNDVRGLQPHCFESGWDYK